VDGPQVFFVCAVGAASPNEPSGYGVDYLLTPTSVGLWGVISSSPPVSTPITLSWARGGSVSSPRRLLFAWGTTRFAGTTHKASEVSGLNELFYFVFQGLAFLGGVASILVVSAPFTAVGVFWAQGPPGWWYQLDT